MSIKKIFLINFTNDYPENSDLFTCPEDAGVCHTSSWIPRDRTKSSMRHHLWWNKCIFLTLGCYVPPKSPKALKTEWLSRGLFFDSVLNKTNKEVYKLREALPKDKENMWVGG